MFIWFLPIYSHLLLIFHKQTVFWCHHICSSNSFSTHSNGESQPQAVAWGAHRDLPQVVRTISRVGEAIPWGWFMALCLPRYMNWMDLVRVYSDIVGILKNQWWLAIWYSVGTLDSWYIYIPEGCNPVPIWLIHNWRRLESCHNPVGPAQSATVVRCNCWILGCWSGEKYLLIMVNGILMVHNGILMGYSSNIVTCYPAWWWLEWFGTMDFLWLSHHIGNFIIPTDFHSIIFQRGRLKPPTSISHYHFLGVPHPSPSFTKQGQN
jgi:hypothetical protein